MGRQHGLDPTTASSASLPAKVPPWRHTLTVTYVFRYFGSGLYIMSGPDVPTEEMKHPSEEKKYLTSPGRGPNTPRTGTRIAVAGKGEKGNRALGRASETRVAHLRQNPLDDTGTGCPALRM